MSKLKQLRLAHDIQRKRQELEAKEAEAEALKTRRADLEQRSEVAEGAIEEVNDETPAEDVAAMEQQTDALIAEDKQLSAEENENEQQRSALQEEIQRLEAELEEINTRAREAAKPQTGAAGVSVSERKEVYTMDTRKILGLTYEQRRSLFTENDSVRNWMEKVRNFAKSGGSTRDIENGWLTVPDVLLGIVRENTAAYSKLMPYIDVRNVSGDGQILVDGVVPTPVYTDQCGDINEMNLGMYMTEVGSYRLAGFIPICNALLKDSANPVSLGTELVSKMAKGHAREKDKAIVYGTGVRMPLGIVTRLLQTSKPSNTSPEERPWVDLSTTNVGSFAMEGMQPEEIFANIVKLSGAASNEYANGQKIWIMSEKTKNNLLAASLAMSAAGVVVGGINGTMPVTGEPIISLNFMPENVIVTGYAEHYLLAEREGLGIDESEHVRFLKDQTVFRSKERHDGKPVIAEAFAAMHIAGGTVTADAVSFAPDKANTGA